MFVILTHFTSKLDSSQHNTQKCTIMFFGKQQEWNLTNWHPQWVMCLKFDVQFKSPPQFHASFIVSCVTLIWKIDNSYPARSRVMILDW